MEIKYWNSVEDKEKSNTQNKLTSTENGHNELGLLSEELQAAKSTRRDFLKMCGFSLSAAAFAASCKAPVQKAIPYLIKPEEVTPGVANYYASTMLSGTEYASVLVKTREGRPIKIEGNDKSTLSNGGSTARVQASVLDLYDDARLKSPVIKNKKAKWDDIDKAVMGQLAKEDANNVLLTASNCSPSTLQMIQELLDKYPGTEWIVYDAVSYAAVLDANNKNFGSRIIPDYRFDKAKYVLSFAADFLGTWLSPATFAYRYAESRRVTPENPAMSKHIQFESGMSLSGSNADERIALKTSDIKKAVFSLYQILKGASKTDLPLDMTPYANALLANKGNSIVLSGINDIEVQLTINAINDLLGNYGNTLDIENPWLTAQSDDQAMKDLIERMNNAEVQGLIMYDCNPAYDFALSDSFTKGLEQLDFTASLAYRMDETASLCQYVGAANHYLESWGDAQALKNQYSLAQPAIQKLFDTRSFDECLLKWIGSDTDHYSYLRNYWKDHVMNLQEQESDFDAFWTKSLQSGVFEVENKDKADIAFTAVELGFDDTETEQTEGNYEVDLYQCISMGDGRQGNNPWLLELPDPISKSSWGNHFAISPADAKAAGIKTGDIISVNGIEAPAIIQAGQAKGSLSIALGYGHEKTGKAGNGVGSNVYQLARISNGYISYAGIRVSIEPTGEKDAIAFAQTHNTLEQRPIIHETNIQEYAKNPIAGNELHEEIKEELHTLYAEVVFNGPHWGMSIDLNACIGCGSCVIACQAENNVAVVGKELVRNDRIMHWIRIDRYYSDDINNPKVVHLPVMCQQCDNAPCENVCPVAATMHNEEGINQMAYNRCIGTRYCINNCPYRVRRFNWFEYVDNDKFDYNMNNELGKMVLNPDAVVRSRGVVEKCSFCIQRIQDSKLKAKMENRDIIDGELKSACMQSCPTKAIVFGDLNNKESQVSKLFENERNYHLLEELHTLPSVGYLTKVRNTEDKALS